MGSSSYGNGGWLLIPSYEWAETTRRGCGKPCGAWGLSRRVGREAMAQAVK